VHRAISKFSEKRKSLVCCRWSGVSSCLCFPVPGFIFAPVCATLADGSSRLGSLRSSKLLIAERTVFLPLGLDASWFWFPSRSAIDSLLCFSWSRAEHATGRFFSCCSLFCSLVFSNEFFYLRVLCQFCARSMWPPLEIFVAFRWIVS
jgi:hypothetical protein